mgnify:CR=1 FL=1
MLVMSRKPGESIQVGDGVNITVVEIKGTKIRLGITAGKETTILRGELSPSRAIEDEPRPLKKKAA